MKLLYEDQHLRSNEYSLKEQASTPDRGWTRTLPFFCMMTVVTTYLKGLFKSAKRLIQVSRQVDVH